MYLFYHFIIFIEIIFTKIQIILTHRKWEQRKLGEVATLSSSKRIHLSDYVRSGVPFYRGSEISTGGITSDQELFISEEKYREIIENYDIP